MIVERQMPTLPILPKEAFFRLTYGVYLLTTRHEGRDFGCIVNTVMQVTDKEKKFAVALSRDSFTHEMILRSGTVCVSVLCDNTPFSLIEHFGYHSGRETDKFAPDKDLPPLSRSESGLFYLSRHACAYFDGKIQSVTNLGTHDLFIVRVTEADVIAAARPLSYRDYLDHVKPKTSVPVKNRFVCRVCGYVYEGESLPLDYICPVCHHGVDYFDKAGNNMSI